MRARRWRDIGEEIRGIPCGTRRGERKRLSLTFCFWEHSYRSRGNFKFHARIFILFRIRRIIDYFCVCREKEFGEVCRHDLKIEDFTGKM